MVDQIKSLGPLLRSRTCWRPSPGLVSFDSLSAPSSLALLCSPLGGTASCTGSEASSLDWLAGRGSSLSILSWILLVTSCLALLPKMGALCLDRRARALFSSSL